MRISNIQQARRAFGDRLHVQQPGLKKNGNVSLKNSCLDSACQALGRDKVPGPAKNFRKNQAGMNRLETRFEKEYLLPLFWSGDILDYRFEHLKLRLGHKAFYTPDFFVVHPDEFQIFEVKGHWEDDARVKIKWAAQKYFYFRFFGTQRKNGEWVFEEIPAKN